MLVYKPRSFGVVTPCGAVVGYQRFRAPCCLHLQGQGYPTIAVHSVTIQKNST